MIFLEIVIAMQPCLNYSGLDDRADREFFQQADAGAARGLAREVAEGGQGRQPLGEGSGGQDRLEAVTGQVQQGATRRVQVCAVFTLAQIPAGPRLERAAKAYLPVWANAHHTTWRAQGCAEEKPMIFSGWRELANSALDSGICRGGTNEMGRTLCDNSRRTGAAISAGSIPAPATICTPYIQRPGMCSTRCTTRRAGEWPTPAFRLDAPMPGDAGMAGHITTTASGVSAYPQTAHQSAGGILAAGARSL